MVSLLGGILMDKNWIKNEFKDVNINDKRLKKRLISLSERFAEAPEDSINKCCNGWSETKAAYRFFQNDSVSVKEITESHAKASVKRASEYDRVLVIQDTTYMSYKHHPKTKGLCVISKDRNGKDINGIIMHTAMTVSTEGLPLGVIDQQIYSRPELTEEEKETKRKTNNADIPYEEKESYRWGKSSLVTKRMFSEQKVQIVMMGDREIDSYDFLELSETNKIDYLIRGKNRRKIKDLNGKDVDLYEYFDSESVKGILNVEILPKQNTKSRTAICEIKYSKIVIEKPTRNKTEQKSSIELYAIYVNEKDTPENIEPIKWLLLTNLPVRTEAEAREKIDWYCLRWRIEIFFKILKSGLKVEDCRLSQMERLKRYLTIMSIIAWRIQWLTYLARTVPNAVCTYFLKEYEWKLLFKKIHKSKSDFPEKPPSIKECVSWIAQLGGFLNRKNDGDPGVTHIWRGLHKFADMVEGFEIALDIYG